MANRYWSPIEDAQIILERALVYVGSLWGSNDSYQNAWSVTPPDSSDTDPDPNNDLNTGGNNGGNGDPAPTDPTGKKVEYEPPKDPTETTEGEHPTCIVRRPGDNGPWSKPLCNEPTTKVTPGPGEDPEYYPVPDGADPSGAWRIRQWGRFISIYDAYGVLILSWAIDEETWQGLGAVAYLWRYTNADWETVTFPPGASLGLAPVGLAFEVDACDLWLKPVGFMKPFSYATVQYMPDILVVNGTLYVGELFQDTFVDSASFVRRGGRQDQPTLPYSVANLMWLAGYGSSLRMVQS